MERPKPPEDMVVLLRKYSLAKDPSLCLAVEKFASAQDVTREEGEKLTEAYKTAQVWKYLDVIESTGHSVL